MFVKGIAFPITHRTPYVAVSLCLVLFLFYSFVDAGGSPPSKAKQSNKSISLPRNYCLANTASLGTGLARVPVSSRTKSSFHKRTIWAGWVRASASGRYEFSLPDGAGRILVNKQEVFSRSAMSFKPVVIKIELLTNRYYAVTVEMPNSGNSTLPLQWLRPDGRQETVPKAYLYPPLATTESALPT